MHPHREFSAVLNHSEEVRSELEEVVMKFVLTSRESRIQRANSSQLELLKRSPRQANDTLNESRSYQLGSLVNLMCVLLRVKNRHLKIVVVHCSLRSRTYPPNTCCHH